MPIQKTDKKKDGLQQYKVRVNYIDSQGNYKQLTRIAYGLDNAKSLERELNVNLKSETQKKMSLNQLYEEYIQSKKYEVRESSLDRITKRLKNYCLPVLGTHRIDKINTATIQKWKTGIEEYRTSAGKPLSLETKQSIYRTFRQFLGYAVKMEYIPRNPTDNIGNFKDAYFTTTNKIDYFTADEFLSFIKVAEQSAKEQEQKTNSIYDWNYYVFFNIAYYTGMRKGEINALQWTDIDGDIIHITKSVTQKLKGADRITPPKNKSSVRDIQIPTPLKKVLTEHKQRLLNNGLYDDNFYICGGEKSIRDTSLENKNIAYSTLAGVKKIRIHDFRHSHATLLANNGINIQEIARRLGHSKIEMTWNTYAHLYPRENEKAIEILNKIQ